MNPVRLISCCLTDNIDQRLGHSLSGFLFTVHVMNFMLGGIIRAFNRVAGEQNQNRDWSWAALKLDLQIDQNLGPTPFSSVTQNIM